MAEANFFVYGQELEEEEMDTINFLEEDLEVEEQMVREMSMDNP